MSGVSSAESAALVLRYLETSAFRRTAGTFRREASKLLKSIVAPPTVKPLIGILNEYVELKEADSRRKQLAQANSVVGDLLAVIENQAGKASAQPNQADMQHDPSSAEQQVSEPQLPASDQPYEVDMLSSESSLSAMDSMAAVEHVPDATPAHQQADQHAKRLASSFPRPQSSSQHRKGAPRRRTEQSDRAASPISRLALSSLGDGHRNAAGTEWMNLPMTEDGFSSLMQDDSFQQRFAEGLATHLTSGAEGGIGTDNHYDALLASLPADPAMAGLLEPLVLPADAYQIPAETHRLLSAHPSHQEASADQHQPPSHMHQTASDPAMALESAATLSSQNGGGSLPTHASVRTQSVANQQPADQPAHLAGMLGLQQDTVSCHSLHHAGDARAPYPQMLQQAGQQNATQAGSAQLYPETITPSSLPLQHSTGTLGVPAVPSHSLTQNSTAHAQQAASCCGQGKPSIALEEQESPDPDQLQGLPSASTSMPAADQLPQKHGAPQLVRRSIVAAEAAALDSLYATIFPDRQVAKASTGALRPSRTSKVRLGYLQDSTAAPPEAATAVLCNLSDDQHVPTATETAGTSSRKRQRRLNSPNAAAQPASSALPDQHTKIISHSNSGADPEQGRLANDQQQQYLTEAAAPAYEQAQEGVTSMACGKATEHISSVIPACASDTARMEVMAAELADCDADCSPPWEPQQRPVLASLPSNQLLDAPTAGAVAGVDAVQPSDVQQKVPQEVFRQGQNIASFNPAAIEEFIKALHGKS